MLGTTWNPACGYNPALCATIDVVNPSSNPRIATPPAPPVDTWKLAPTDAQEAAQLVQDIANQQMSAQQGIDASQIKYVMSDPFHDAKGLIFGYGSDDSSSGGSSIPWGMYLLLGGTILAVYLLGGHRGR